MIFPGYFNYTYTVEELSCKQLKGLLAQQSTEESTEESTENGETNKNSHQFLNGSYSFRTNLDKKPANKT